MWKNEKKFGQKENHFMINSRFNEKGSSDEINEL